MKVLIPSLMFADAVNELRLMIINCNPHIHYGYDLFTGFGMSLFWIVGISLYLDCCLLEYSL